MVNRGRPLGKFLVNQPPGSAKPTHQGNGGSEPLGVDVSLLPPREKSVLIRVQKITVFIEEQL